MRWRCAKCGSYKINLKYIYPSEGDPDFMSCVCKRCGYAWQGTPHDRNQENTEEKNG